MDPVTVAAIDGVLRDRRTLKLRADVPLPVEPLDDDVVDELCAAAGWAPFHRPAADGHRSGDLDSIVPFRLHVVDAAGCRRLREHLLDTAGASSATRMLAVARTLIQATWLPDPAPAGDGLFAPTIENMEHVAAAAAAIQNVLLAATARGIPSYWSSGGVLRTGAVFARLGIPREEILLGAVYLFPEEVAVPDGGVEVKRGAHRERRGPIRGWSRRVTP